MIRKAGTAQAMIAVEDRAAARELLKQFVALYPNEPGVHYMYGLFLLKEDTAAAAGEFVLETKVAPNEVPAYIQAALVDLKNNNYQDGLKYVQKAEALEPNNFIAHVACGQLWLNLDKPKKALKELDIAVKLSPNSPHAHLALSRALFKAGQKTEAAAEEAEYERLKDRADADDVLLRTVLNATSPPGQQQ
jgi:predicted Zn-dependent protease